MQSRYHKTRSRQTDARIGDLFRSLLGARGCVILGALSGDGLARHGLPCLRWVALADRPADPGSQPRHMTILRLDCVATVGRNR